MGLGFASVPQVDEGFVDVEDDHGRPGPQAAAVTGHLQQVPFHGHFSAHTVQPPLACRGHRWHSQDAAVPGGGAPAGKQSLQDSPRPASSLRLAGAGGG